MGYRQIVQHWEQSIEPLAQKELTKENFDILEQAVLKDDLLDKEILAMVARRPSVFYLALLPTLSAGEAMVDQAAKEVLQAQVAAASSQLKVFMAELKVDWLFLSQVSQGHSQLKELLQWLALEHRRSQAKLADELVTSKMDACHPLLSVANWEALPSQLSMLLRTVEREGQTRVIFWLDFNTPYSRDSLKMPKLLAALGSAAKIVGAKSSVLLMIMPSVGKEGSTASPEEDEMNIVTSLSKQGFTNLRFRQVFSMHPSVANKTSEVEWFCDGRLACIGDIKDNDFLKSSELARIRRVLEECQLPQLHELVPLSSLDENEDINQVAIRTTTAVKSAQRGPRIAEVQLSALLQKVDLSPKDLTVVVDLMPYVGDRTVALHNFMKSQAAENKGAFRGVVVQQGLKSNDYNFKAALFARQRLKVLMMQEWQSRSLVLYQSQTASNGTTSQVAVYPKDTVRDSGVVHVPGFLCLNRFREPFCLRVSRSSRQIAHTCF
jgi:hypothetical protein